MHSEKSLQESETDACTQMHSTVGDSGAFKGAQPGAHTEDPFSCHQMSKIVQVTLQENFVGAGDGNK